MTDFPTMLAAFRTTVSGGGKYEMVFRFPSMDGLHAADDEWRAALATPASDVAPVGEGNVLYYRSCGRCNGYGSGGHGDSIKCPACNGNGVVRLAHPPLAQSVDPAAVEALREDQVEVAAMAFAKAFYGPGFDPFTNPEAYAMAEDAARAALTALKGPAA